MTARMTITDRGREWLSRFLANYDTWVPAGYDLFSYAKWGEGGWEEVSGVREPRDPTNHVAENDLDVIVNPGLYPGTSQYVSADIPIDLSAEILYLNDPNATIQIQAVLEDTEENDDGGGDNPDFWEVGIFDNSNTMPDPTVRNDTGVSEDSMILYATFDAVSKTSTRTFTVDFNIPWVV